MLIDTHAHVNFRSFKDDARETLQRALDNGTWVINVGSQIDTSRQAVELANQFNEGIYAVVGLHPEHTHSQFVDEEETHFLTREEKFDYELYKKLARDSKVVGIGECGLDYYRMPADTDPKIIKDKQKEAFRQQLRLAKELNKVLVIHSRPAKGDESLFDDLINILDEELIFTRRHYEGVLPTEESLSDGEEILHPSDALGVQDDAKLRFEVHSYTGSPEYLQKFLDRGAYVSFNGIITFDKTGNMEKLVKLAPLDKIILETDCPYLTPVPNRGKRNEPANVQYVAGKVAAIKGLGVEEVAVKTTKNAISLFLLPVST
jgi:TatD DNase family protein